MYIWKHQRNLQLWWLLYSRCKNFFKRSVLVCLERPYVCKYSGNCSVSVTAIDGVKQKGPRCQACRYAACLDAGMYHSGVQRSRGGRHNHAGSGSNSQQTPNKKQTNNSSYLQVQTEVYLKVLFHHFNMHKVYSEGPPSLLKILLFNSIRTHFKITPNAYCRLIFWASLWNRCIIPQGSDALSFRENFF